MRILVTGGAGFIGSHYVRSMLAGKYPEFETARVTVLDKLTYAGNPDNLPIGHPRLELVVGDVCDGALLRDLLPGHDAVVHFAAESHVDRSIVDAETFVRTNVGGTHSLLNACLDTGVERFIQVSTDEVYGSIAEGSWTEDYPLAPNSPYAASKAAADLLARAYGITHGLHVTITRCANNYGPHQHPEKVIPRFITNILEGEPIPVYGDGRHVREWLHVDDHCRAVQLVLTEGKPGAIYHIGGGSEHTNLELADRLLAEAGGSRSMLRHVDDRKGHDRRYSLDATKIREELGFEPQISFPVGIAETVAWYRANTAWWRRRKETAHPKSVP